MKLREKHKKLILKETADYEVHIIVSNNIRESRQKRNSLFGEMPDVNFAGMHSTNGNGLSYIFLPEGVDSGVLTHEAFHCIWSIHEFIGAKFESELTAYMLTYIVREIEKLLYKK